MTEQDNVVQDAGVWAFTNANANNNTDDNTFTGNWYNGGATEIATGAPHDNISAGNTVVSGYNWPLAAQQVMYNAGIEPGLRTAADTSAAPGGVALTVPASAIAPGQAAAVAVDVENFSTRPLKDVTASLTVPTGWTASAPSARNVAPGATVSIPVTVTAPSALDGPIVAGSLTATVSYRSDGRNWSLSRTGQLVAANPVASPLETSGSGSSPSYFGEANGVYAISNAGQDAWGPAGSCTTSTAPSTRRRAPTPAPSSPSRSPTRTTRLMGQGRTGDPRRPDEPGASTGYAVVALTPGNGVTFQWDGSSQGYLNNTVQAGHGTTAPVWLRLVRNGAQVTGEYSTDGTTWNTVGTATLTGSNAAEDAGMFNTAHDTGGTAGAYSQADFTNFTITG